MAGLAELNSARNGRRLNRLVVGKLPKQLHCVARFVRQYRRDLGCSPGVIV